MWNERLAPGTVPESDDEPKRGNPGCLFGCTEWLVIIVLCFLATGIALLTIGGGYERLLVELAATPSPLPALSPLPTP